MIDFLKFALKESMSLFKVIGAVVLSIAYFVLFLYVSVNAMHWASAAMIFIPIIVVWLRIMWVKYELAQEEAAKAVAEKLAYESTRERIVAAGSLFPAAAKPVTKPPLTNAQILAQLKSGKYP